MSEVLSPMPGIIVNILVKSGDLVKEDSQVIVLEAMKMESPILSGFEGTVKEIMVKEREAVEINQVLLMIE